LFSAGLEVLQKQAGAAGVKNTETIMFWNNKLPKRPSSKRSQLLNK
jgi:hypothetical protein